MYAIVDIETTGGHAAAGHITEVAIILHNGHQEEGSYHTLVNPGVPVPRYISVLTGITNEMLYSAPAFESVASKIYELLQGRIFVAHNVNFDYSFLKHQLGHCGFDLQERKLCTVRMGRKVFPGLASYSLGNLCRELQIQIQQRHRAMGDVRATVRLFEMILEQDQQGVVQQMKKGKNAEQYLPPLLPAAQVTSLPLTPGVYYFHDQKGKILYVGKASCLQQRVKSHFSNNDKGKRKQEFLRRIHAVTYKECSSELAALILESVEIRRLWPPYNRSQKKFHQEYGLYCYEDQSGYMRLFIEKKKKQLPALYTFNLLHEGQVLLRKMATEFSLHPGLCYIDKTGEIPLTETAAEHNSKVQQAVSSLTEQLPSFLLKDTPAAQAQYVLIEKGRFIGMGYLQPGMTTQDLDSIREQITKYPDNDYIRRLVYQYAEKFPENKIDILL